MIPLSQRDPRWAKNKLGFSNLTIGGYGCTLTCLTMFLNEAGYNNLTPDYVNDELKKVKGFTGALILWANITKAFPKVKWSWRGYNYDNLKVSYYVYIKRLPVLVEVNGAKIGAPKHWVLFLGNRKAADPWTGKIIPTDYYPLTGYSLIDRS